jgi:hypothetical protein
MKKISRTVTVCTNKQGHLAANCNVVIKCEICGGHHRTITCFEDPRNAHRHPEKWESRLTEAEKKRHFGSEKAMANIDGISVGDEKNSNEGKHVQWKEREVLLANIDMSKAEKEFEEPSLWVGPYVQKEWLDEDEEQEQDNNSEDSDGEIPELVARKQYDDDSDDDSDDEWYNAMGMLEKEPKLKCFYCKPPGGWAVKQKSVEESENEESESEESESEEDSEI